MKIKLGALKRLISETTSGIAQKLADYAEKYQLIFYTSWEDIESDMTFHNVVIMNDHTNEVPIVWQNGRGLQRYGLETLDEDPGETFSTTFQELEKLGDPWRWGDSTYDPRVNVKKSVGYCPECKQEMFNKQTGRCLYCGFRSKKN